MIPLSRSRASRRKRRPSFRRYTSWFSSLYKKTEPNFVSQVKQSATRRKGRGFDDDRRRNRNEDGYDRIGDSDVAAGGGNEPGPQRSVEGWILFITGIHEEAQEDDIHDKVCNSS